MNIIKTLIKKINSKRQQKFHEKCKMMNSEIICAIAHQVRKEQEQCSVSIPAFIEVQTRYNRLQIKSYNDVVNTYKTFYRKGMVSGINL